MKKILHKPIRGERGGVMVLALILLVVGGLIITPLMGFMSTGLRVAQTDLEKMHELYAADAGVEDAIWHLISENLTVPTGESSNLTLTVNNKTVNVTIAHIVDQDYKITATAGGTTIESYVRIAIKFTEELQELLDEGETITGDVIAEGNVELGEDAKIYGDVIAGGNVELGKDAKITGDVIAGGNVELGATATIGGNVYARMDVELGATATIGGNVYLYPGATISFDEEFTGTKHDQITGTIHHNFPWEWPRFDAINILTWKIS